MFGTKIELQELNDFDTSIPTGINHNIKGQPAAFQQSGMFGPEQQSPVQPEQPQMIPLQLPMQSPESECVKNARHCETCPICSKLYNNNTTYHNYAILFLLVVCILLIKNLYSYHNRE